MEATSAVPPKPPPDPEQCAAGIGHPVLAGVQAYLSGLQAVADTSGDWVYFLDAEGELVFSADTCRDLLGYEPGELMADPWSLLRIVHPADRGALALSDERALVAADAARLELRLITKDDTVKHFLLSQRVIADDRGVVAGRVVVVRLLREQEADLTAIDSPVGGELITICAACKKIRDQGVWCEVEQYLHRHAGMQFSHGFCSECAGAYFRKLERR